MIDTDKYEGHTPAPWNADDDGGGKHLHIDAYGEEGDVCVARMVNGNWIDTQLIADAPRLLAEVKRLYEMMDLLASFHIVKNVEQGVTQREWVQLVEVCKGASVKRGEEE